MVYRWRFPCVSFRRLRGGCLLMIRKIFLPAPREVFRDFFPPLQMLFRNFFLPLEECFRDFFPPLQMLLRNIFPRVE